MEDEISFGGGLFSGAMLVLGSVTITGSPGDLLGTSLVGSFPPVSPCDHLKLRPFQPGFVSLGPREKWRESPQMVVDLVREHGTPYFREI